MDYISHGECHVILSHVTFPKSISSGHMGVRYSIIMLGSRTSGISEGSPAHTQTQKKGVHMQVIEHDILCIRGKFICSGLQSGAI